MLLCWTHDSVVILAGYTRVGGMFRVVILTGDGREVQSQQQHLHNIDTDTLDQKKQMT
jgi:hypothetical protein